MKNHWLLQEAKARLSEVVRAAQTDGPQEISLRGRPAAVLVCARDWRKRSICRPSLVEFIRNSPLAKGRVKIERDGSPAREVDL